MPKARVIVEALTGLDDALATAVEQRVLPRAGQQTTGQLRASLSRAVLAADPAAAEVRHQRAVAERLVTVRPLADGMAGLWALLPADGAAALYDRARRSSPATHRPAIRGPWTPGAPTRCSPCHSRLPTRPPTAARRPGPAPARGARSTSPSPPPPRSASADEPGHLAGHGPVPASMARRLAAPRHLAPRASPTPPPARCTDVGRTRYTPSAALADLVRTRDVTCRFPGCRQPAHRCDLDHLIPWPAGPTTAANLATLCRHHHRLKHQTSWHVHADDPATLTWTSPTGHRYTTTRTRSLRSAHCDRPARGPLADTAGMAT